MRFTRFLFATFVVVAAILPAKGRAQAKTQGWVGIVFTTGIGEANSSGTLVFSDYPVIESIDPGSPAEQAGLRAGDILIALNSQDFRKNPIPMSSLIVPGNRVTFRYKRDDVTRTSTLTVADRPDGTSSRTVFNLIQPLPERAEVTGTRVAREQAGRARTVTIRERAAAGASFPRVTVPIIFGPGSPSVAIAGAELTQLNDGLRELVNFKGDGVFVINVGMGTPAANSGLKSGDVIIKAEQEVIQNPGELIRIMWRTTESAMLLQVLRNQKARNITLRW